MWSEEIYKSYSVTLDTDQAELSCRQGGYVRAIERWRRCLREPTSPSGGNNSHSDCILPGSPLKTSSYAFKAEVKGDVIPLVSPKRFKTRCSPRLDAGTCDMLCATICLLLLGSTGGVRPLSAVTSGSSRSDGCLGFVIRPVKRLRRPPVEVGDGVRLTSSVVATTVASPSAGSGHVSTGDVNCGGSSTGNIGGETNVHLVAFAGVSTRDASAS
jgi:hypothetical protein